MGTARLGRGFAIALLGISLFPGVAQAGFFDFLFPQFRAPAPRFFESRPGYRQWGGGPGYHRHSFHRHKVAVHRKIILADKTDHPVRPHAPINIMNDESLQEGDAVMTHAGIRIFVGDYGRHHKPSDFRKLSEIKGLSTRERKALAAFDAPGSNSGGTGGKTGLVTGRSATDAAIVTGETITDARGRTIRYVGP